MTPTPRKIMPSWTVAGLGRPFRLSAWTKGEARALAKAQLGIKGRLPIGADLSRAPTERTQGDVIP